MRVLVLCAAIGEGHVTAARSLVRRLQLHSDVSEVQLREDLGVLGARLGRFLERGFHTHLEHARWTYELSYRLFFERRLPRETAQRILGRLAAGGLRSAIAEYGPDVVVAEFPVLSAALGELRARGQLSVPVCSAISDPAGLQYWVHPGLDLHLLSWPEAQSEAEQIGGGGRERAPGRDRAPGRERAPGRDRASGRTVVVRAMVDERFHEAPSREEARGRLSLPTEAEVVTISGGGWGMGEIGELVATVRQARPEATVIALAGRNRELQARLVAAAEAHDRIRVLGFTPQMPELMAAADALIHTTGGTTALEARVVGCPLINFGRGVAHVRAHAARMAELGLAEWAQSLAELPAALDRTLRRPRPGRLTDRYPDPAEVVLGVARTRPPRGSEAANQLAAAASASAAGPGS